MPYYSIIVSFEICYILIESKNFCRAKQDNGTMALHLITHYFSL